MKIDIDRDGKTSRQQVWLTAWCYVATASNCVDKDAPAKWADQCLSDFDERFHTTTDEARQNKQEQP